MRVHKFGGTSVGDAQRIAGVVEIIMQAHKEETSPGSDFEATQPGTAVVVSAMSGVTDQLIAGGWAAAEGRDRVFREIKAHLLERHLLAAEALLGSNPERLEVSGMIEDRLHELERLYRSIAILGEFTARGCDAVSSVGEMLSASLLAATLRERGERAQAISAVELIVTDDHYGQARPLIQQTNQRLARRILPLIQRGTIPVITGYTGASENGAVTTLGRGGSDYTAAIIGAGLGAKEVWIWSDVNGILTADPGLVPEARTLNVLSYSEAAELAYYGADVLHPKTILPLVESGIPLRILNSFNPAHPGTLIVKSPASGRVLWPAIISTSGLSLIAVGSRDDAWSPQDAARVLHLLGETGVDVLLFSQSFSEHSLNLVVREQEQEHCLNVLQREFGNGNDWSDSTDSQGEIGGQNKPYRTNGSHHLGVKEKVATVSVVGFPSWSEAGIVSHAFTALGRHGTRVIAVAQAGAGGSVSFCISQEQVESTVRYLHHALRLDANA